jgi:hypothetical protein
MIAESAGVALLGCCLGQVAGCWQGAERATSIVGVGPGWDMRSTEGRCLRRFWVLYDQQCGVVGPLDGPGC